MSGSKKPDFDSYLAQAYVWLQHGQEDHNAAKRLLRWNWLPLKNSIVPNNPVLLIYLLQQSVEKTAKSLMVASGTPETTLRVSPYGHNSLQAVLSFIEKRINVPGIQETLDSLSRDPSLGVSSADEAQRALQNLKKNTQKNIDYFSLAVLPPEVMGVLTSLMDVLRQQSLHKTREVFPVRMTLTIEPSKSDGLTTSDYLFSEVTAATRGAEIPADLRDTFSSAIGRVAALIEDEFGKGNTLRIIVPRRWIISNYVLPAWALPTLYLLAALTFPHEASTRYPARLGSHEDPVQAARRNRLGTMHYSDSLGIIKHFRDLHRINGLVLKSMPPLIVQANEAARTPPEQ